MLKCKLCQHGGTVIINTKVRKSTSDEVRVYSCESCGVQFLHPYYSEAQLMEYYDTQYRQEYTNEEYYLNDNMKAFYEQSLQEARSRVARVTPLLSYDDDILEIGCSSGYFLSEAAPFVATVCGTEWDSKNRKFAQALGHTVEKDVENFQYKFDKIFMFHVLEHIVEPIEFLRNLKQYLKPGGSLFIEVPNNEDILLTTYDLQEFRDFYYQSAHVWYFNRKSLEYLLRKSGYDHCSVVPIQRYDFSNHIQWLKKRLPGGQGKYVSVFSDEVNYEYVKCLKKSGQTDTLFITCRV